MESGKNKPTTTGTVGAATTPTQTISDIYNEAYAVIDQGICCDEVGFSEGAITMYERGLTLIAEAKKFKDSTKNDMYQKMAKAKEHILSRLVELKKVQHPDSTDNTNMSATEALPPFDLITNTLSCFGNVKNAEELLVIPDGVQLFFIKGQETSVPSYPSFLKIFKFSTNGAEQPKRKEGEAKGAELCPAFLQVSDWVYPLTPGRSPVLHSSYGAYIFPDPTVDAPDTYVGVILPKDLEASAASDFVKLIKQYTAYKEETEPPQLTEQEQERLAARIASFLTTSTEYVVMQLKKGSMKSSDYICRQSMKIRDNTSNVNAITVDPRVQTSVHYLRTGTKIAVKVSGYLVDKIGALGASVGRKVAASLDKRLQPGGSCNIGKQAIKDLIYVTSAGVSGAATIWVALEEVSKTLAKCIANETVVVVDHKYGEQAADVTNNFLYSAGFAATTAWHIESLGMGGIAKRTAKAASLAFLKDLSDEEKIRPGLSEKKGEQKDESRAEKSSSPLAEQKASKRPKK